MRYIILFLFIGQFAFADGFNQGIAPLDVRGYMANVDTRTVEDITETKLKTMNSSSSLFTHANQRNNAQIHPNLLKIQQQNLGQMSEIALEYSQPTIQSTFQHTSNAQAEPRPIAFTTETIEDLCYDIGFHKETERDAMKFYNCITQVMKTKFTEETLKNTQYTEFDSNIARALSSYTAIDEIITNFIQYEETLTQRNKLDCLKYNDYHKCIVSVIKFKKCHNKAVFEIKNHNIQNKVICYVKTALHFPNPDEIQRRDSYFSVCNYLIQKPLKTEITSSNAKCNQILTNNNLFHSVV